MSKKRLVPILFMLLVLSVSCSRKEEALWSPGTGGVTIDVTAGLPATKAEVTDVQLDPDDFKIEVINSDGVIFKRWNTFAEYKSQEGAGFQMNAGGPYLIRAVYGDSTASGFQALFYMGEQEFTVLPQQTTAVSVVCRMGNVRLEVEYGENIRKDYTDIRTTVYSDRGSVIFGQDCSQPGYIPAGELSVYVQLTDEAGGRKYFRNGSSIIAAAGDVITLKIDTNPIEKENVLLAVNVDSSTDRKDVDVTLPSFMLPAGAPELTATFTEEGAPVSYVEGVRPEGSPFVVGMNVPAGIYGLKVSVGSPNQELAWASELDLVNLTQEQRSKLTSAGFTVPELYRSQSQQIDFMAIAMLVRALDGDPEQSLSIEVTDGLGKTAGGTWALAPRVASKSIDQVNGGYARAHRIENVVLRTDGNMEQLYPVVRVKGTPEWTRPEFNETQSSDGVKTVTVTGLEPMTQYEISAAYVDNSNLAEAVYEFSTEAASQVGNAGFEEWTTLNHQFTYETFFGLVSESHDISWDLPWIGEQWWAANSKKTMPSSTGVVNTNWNMVRFPTVAYTTDSFRGKAAMIYSVNVGDALTSAALVGIKVAGELFIGTADDSGNHASDGHAFDSRPDVLRFHYKYLPKDSETFYVKIEIKSADGNVIASAERSDGPASSGWTSMDLRLDYKDMTADAAAIYIAFKSSTAGTPGINGNYELTIRDNEKYTGNFGSILYVDDIELIYE